MRPTKFAPVGHVRPSPRNQLLADAVIRLIDSGLMTATNRRRLPELIVQVSQCLQVPVTDLRDAWRRLEANRGLSAFEMRDLGRQLDTPA